MGRSDDRLADPCQTMRHGFEPADHAAPCANLPGGPVLGTVPTGAPDMGYDWGAIGRSRAMAYPIALKTLTTLDLLGLSPIAAGILQLLTFCAVAALWAIALADWLTADQRRQVQLLRIAGCSQAAIGRRLGLSPYHVRKLLK
jgi:hypothetical protein